MKRFAFLSMLILSSLVLADEPTTKSGKDQTWDKPPEMKIDASKTYTVTIDTNKGKIVLELFAKDAPKTVNSFVFLARQNFFNGTIFHRVIPGFMIQGGDPTGTGRGGPGYEFENENKDTSKTFDTGVVGMANSGPNTNGSQFFIMDAPSGLPAHDYTIFGKVKEGQDVVHAIATAPRNEQDRPNDEITMKSVTVDEK
ncbi:MAG TPA: peptidylprolyl isomerase [Tepidisphaeraceae bacterium]|jgi:cyclophilin family peptidyl-prolyl cis-trans isomerase|nr:peptidylprolyl isomerase [Tepidisphaeraceae bacterium]